MMEFLYDIYLYIWLVIALIPEFLGNMIHILCVCKIRKCANLPTSLKGQTIVITGANFGIGKETFKVCLQLGAKVIAACRNMELANKTIEEILNEIGTDKMANITLVHLDLSSLESVRKCAIEVRSQIDTIDVLINNAGVMMCPQWLSKDGFEYQFATNHLGHFLLTNLLVDLLKSSSNARIVNLTSIAHMVGKIKFDDINLESGYNSFTAYARSKLANILFTKELTKRLKGSNVRTYACHPGAVRTGISRYYPKFLNLIEKIICRIVLINPELGAQTTLYCAFDDSIKNETGNYYS